MSEKPPVSTKEVHFCATCGASVQPQQRFCHHCGHPLSNQAPVTTQMAPLEDLPSFAPPMINRDTSLRWAIITVCVLIGSVIFAVFYLR